jgi:hypothetical protein
MHRKYYRVVKHKLNHCLAEEKGQEANDERVVGQVQWSSSVLTGHTTTSMLICRQHGSATRAASRLHWISHRVEPPRRLRQSRLAIVPQAGAVRMAPSMVWRHRNHPGRGGNTHASGRWPPWWSGGGAPLWDVQRLRPVGEGKRVT